MSTEQNIEIRDIAESDSESVLKIFYAVVATEDTFPFTSNTPRDVAYNYWFGPGIKSYVAVAEQVVVGMAELIPNYPGLGAHVANASLMVDPSIQARGMGRKMGIDVLVIYKLLGHKN